MADYAIRLFGDPVLKQTSSEVTNIDGAIARLAEDMLAPMREVRGIGLAAPQVGVLKRMFIYELDDGRGPQTLINPIIEESSGEWEFDEGCLSVPGLYFPIVRPKQVLMTGLDLDGNRVEVEADELTARLFQHELDHLDGTLLLEHLDEVTRKKALKELRKRNMRPI